MNWLNQLLKVITLVPAVVAGIEAIHGSAKSGADKRTLAMQSLGLASGVAGALDPRDQPAIDAMAQAAGSVIDATVAMFNHGGWPSLPASGNGNTASAQAPTQGQ